MRSSVFSLILGVKPFIGKCIGGKNEPISGDEDLPSPIGGKRFDDEKHYFCDKSWIYTLKTQTIIHLFS